MHNNTASEAVNGQVVAPSRSYTKPAVTFLGSFASLTRGGGTGPYADMMLGLMPNPMMAP